MFEAAELGRTVSREEWAVREGELRAQLLEAQFELRDKPFPVIVVISGADGAGKGDTVNRLHEWLDPRGVETHAFGPPSDEERDRPPYWRFWRTLPPRGRIGIFFGSWYTDPIVRRAYGKTRKAELDQSLDRIVRFERLLAADGALIVKFWFHLSREAQEERLTRLAARRRSRWRVTPIDWKHLGMYDRFRKISERALRATDTAQARWRIVEATDDRYRDLTVGETLLEAMRERLARPKVATVAVPAPPRVAGEGASVLDRVDLERTVDGDAYEKALARGQARLARLSRRAKKQHRSSVIVFEGWDAAGKGGTIRRLIEAMDARDYQVVPIAAPSEEERRQPYLWRFWRHIPRAGRVTIFDRSWYGRVLVERVEGFASAAEWQRAYEEIADFEAQLVEAGALVTKFWIHIDPDEQLRRFEARADTAYKRHKITDEDWRNRGKWDAYAAAVNEMVERTSTAEAPWVLVPGNDKRVARLSVLETVCDRLEDAVG